MSPLYLGGRVPTGVRKTRTSTRGTTVGSTSFVHVGDDPSGKRTVPSPHENLGARHSGVIPTEGSQTKDSDMVVGKSVKNLKRGALDPKVP